MRHFWRQKILEQVFILPTWNKKKHLHMHGDSTFDEMSPQTSHVLLKLIYMLMLVQIDKDKLNMSLNISKYYLPISPLLALALL